MRIRTLFACALVLGISLSCSKPAAGPETPEAAREELNERVRIPEVNAAPPSKSSEITEADRTYWSVYSRMFGYGDNFALDGRPMLADLPREGVRDRLLIDIHNITLEALDKMSKELDSAAAGNPAAAHPTSLQTETAEKLKPKLKEAAAKYGIPEEIQQKNPVFSGTNNAPPVK
jgi:hypothetical protein